MKGAGLAPTRPWGFGASDIWAGGGTMNVHWDGTKWDQALVGFGDYPNAIWGCSPDELWLGGRAGVMARRKP